jgi:hypothetical protein
LAFANCAVGHARPARKFVAQGLDALTVERIQGLIKELEQRKASLH